MLAMGLLVLGIASRFIVHLPNFTPVISIALLSGVYIKEKKLALILPVFLLILSDLIIGFHDTILFTWGSMILIALIGRGCRNNKNLKSILLTSFLSSLLFFMVTNFGVWFVSGCQGLYPMTTQGLFTCYIAAIPYFRNELISTLLYSGVLYGLYEVIAKRVKNTRFEHILLSSK